MDLRVQCVKTHLIFVGYTRAILSPKGLTPSVTGSPARHFSSLQVRNINNGLVKDLAQLLKKGARPGGTEETRVYSILECGSYIETGLGLARFFS